jgi:hypothetical protein
MSSSRAARIRYWPSGIALSLFAPPRNPGKA